MFKSKSDRFLQNFEKTLIQINQLESHYSSLNDEKFPKLFKKWEKIIKSKEKTLDDILPDVFAAIREATWRTLKKRHFNTQIQGGYAIHKGKIAEMQTGEGKTIVAYLPAILNSLQGTVHIVTVNDYLAKRDADGMRPLCDFLGLKVSYILESSTMEERRNAYLYSHICYSSNNQITFDFLKNNMVDSLEEKFQGPFLFAIIDEIDSVLIDEARTPLIISGSGDKPSQFYQLINPVMYSLQENFHYKLDGKSQNVSLLDEGCEVIENYLQSNDIIQGSLYDENNIKIFNFIQNLLKAHKGMKLNKQYVVQNKEVVIIDEFTGRLAKSRRFSHGLHQALEAKEQVPIKTENITQAVTSYTNFFRIYKKLGGMTGTASEELNEFKEIYNLDIIVIPTNKKSIRIDHPIWLYNEKKHAYAEILKISKEKHQKGQPILIGTSSVEESEIISELLHLNGLHFHNVLNAKNNENEAKIVAEAGRLNAVTVATNMAGRGTDIQLGGSLDMAIEEHLKQEPDADRGELIEFYTKEMENNKNQVIQSGGLVVLIVGTPDNPKTDRQFRGRSGRQGDPGETFRFFSLEDDVLKMLVSGIDPLQTFLILSYFPIEKIKHVGDRVNKTIREIHDLYKAHHFEIRKNLLKFDDINSDQRSAVYDYRDHLLKLNEEQKKDTIKLFFNKIYKVNQGNDLSNYETKKTLLEKNLELINLDSIILNHFDKLWYRHIANMENLKQTIHITSFEQKDPAQEYKFESFKAFKDMMNDFIFNVVESILEYEDKNDFNNIESLFVNQFNMSSDFSQTLFSNLKDNNLESLLASLKLDLEKLQKNSILKNKYKNEEDLDEEDLDEEDLDEEDLDEEDLDEEDLDEEDLDEEDLDEEDLDEEDLDEEDLEHKKTN